MTGASRASRRNVLLGGVASTALLAAGAWPSAAANDPFDRFMDLSRRLTGRAQLDPLVGRLFYEGLLASRESAAALDALLAEAMAGVGDARVVALEQEILEQWYTGVYQSDGNARKATYGGALMWQAMALRGAPGSCQGDLGFWSRPPTL